MNDTIEYTGEFQHDRFFVRFTADWCAPCKQFAPVFEQHASVNPLPHYVVDVDKFPELASEQGIRSIPAVFAVVGSEWEKMDVSDFVIP